MKKVVFILLCLTLLISSFVLAEEANIEGNKINFQETTNKAVQTEIKIPDYLENPLKFIFGYKEGEKIDISEFILLAVFLIGLLFLLYKIVSIIPFFEGPVISWASTIIILLLISVSGGLKHSVDFLFSLMNFFDILKKWSILKLFVSVFLAVAITLGISTLIKIMKEKARPQKAEELGFRTGAGI